MDPKKLLYIDTMRGWAILMVIACHQALYFGNLSPPVRLLASYGQTGVFLFFVVSAFTLCKSTIQRTEESNATRNFFIRRYFRIAPLC
jgi:peptidoglycan/LPS O-acetylase OafA/YrhL